MIDIATAGALPIKNRGYRAIVADPPWRFENFSDKGEEKNATAHYECMPIGELVALKDDLALDFICGVDCALFMWATWPMINEALALLAAWGFEYKTGGSWHKHYESGAICVGTGYIHRGASEPYLIGTRGRPAWTRAGIPNAIETTRGAHSVKPERLQDNVERLIQGPYLELFARRRRPGWTCWGNELPAEGD